VFRWYHNPQLIESHKYILVLFSFIDHRCLLHQDRHSAKFIVMRVELLGVAREGEWLSKNEARITKTASKPWTVPPTTLPLDVPSALLLAILV
jgi:hypothetical protein